MRSHRWWLAAGLLQLVAAGSPLGLTFAQSGAFNSTIDPQWVTTVEGCSFYERLLSTDVKVSTTIPCRDGKLEGEGLITYAQQGIPYWQWDIARSRGVRMVGGRLQAVLADKNMTASVKECTNWGYEVYVTAPKDLAFEMSAVAEAIDSVGRSAIVRKCGAQAERNLKQNEQVRLFTNGVYELGGEALRDYSRRMAGRRDSLRSAREAAVQQAAATHASDVRLANRQRLAKQVGAYQVAELSAIAPNPFAWKGKTVGVCVMFEQMTSPSSARVRGAGLQLASVSGVPSTRFMRQIVVFLVARVVGQDQGGIALQYLTAVDQPRDDGCSDYIDR